MDLTHINKENHPIMVDVSSKQDTFRVAVASGNIIMSKAAYEALINNTAKKGPVFDTAIVAAIMGAKKTSDFIPMCHPMFLNKVECNIKRNDETCTITLEVIVKCEGKTGVEMEALSGVSIGLLTIYDMLKAIDKNMIIQDISLLHKSGGKSGEYNRFHTKP